MTTAERLYRQYNGSAFHMGREEVIDEYHALGASSGEQTWRRDLISESLDAITRNDAGSLTALETLGAVEALPDLAILAGSGTPPLRLQVAETIGKLVDSPSASRLSPGVVRFALDAAFEAAEDIARRGQSETAEWARKGLAVYNPGFRWPRGSVRLYWRALRSLIRRAG